LGSSLSEFAEERDALAAALQSSNLPIQLWRFENVPASSSPPRSISRDAIERCDAVVVLLGQKLVRFTVDEIDVARALGKPVLVYAKDERSSWTA
jgi:nucleoside 2-deoxyribosyltransferase